MLLVAPDNQHAVVIFSRAGDGGFAIPGYFAGANNITMTLEDAAAFALPFPIPLISTPFRPGNYSSATNGGIALFPTPAPDPSFYTNTPAAMSNFNGYQPMAPGCYMSMTILPRTVATLELGACSSRQCRRHLLPVSRINQHWLTRPPLQFHLQFLTDKLRLQTWF